MNLINCFLIVDAAGEHELKTLMSKSDEDTVLTLPPGKGLNLFL